MNVPSSSTRSTVRKASLFYFVFVMFSYTTGGPFGLEGMVSSSGPGMGLIFLLVIPFLLSIPVSFVAAELTTAMPVEGGFYRWTRAAFGNFWGFLAGWWNWCASFFLGASYGVLFTDYLCYYFPGITGWKHWLVSFALIAFITWLNVRGIQMVGKAATVLELFMFIPVIAMIVIGFAKWHHNPFVPLVPPHQPFSKTFGVGLALAIWGYAGYEQVSSVAGDVENPQRTYPRALAVVIPLSIATYFLPVLAGLAALGNWPQWNDGYFSTAALLIGGPWLGHLMAVAAMAGAVALLNSTMLTAAPMPFALAEAQASALWHALDRDPDLRRHLRTPGAAIDRPIDQHLWVAAGRHHGADRPLRLGTAPQAARFAASFPHSRWQPRTDLCDRPAAGDDLRRLV